MAVPQKLRTAIARMEAADGALADEISKIRSNPSYKEEAREIAPRITTEVPEGLQEGFNTDFALETIVLRVGRPVLRINDNLPSLEFEDVESQIWKSKLEQARNTLLQTIPSVGRIEVKHHPSFEWLGTGWMVAPDIVVTNRHVAQEFGRRNGDGFVFRQLLDKPVSSSIDFLREQDLSPDRSFQVLKILHIEDDRGPDIAFLKVASSGGATLPQALPLFTGTAVSNTDIAVIGYPARDSRIPDVALMEDIFGKIYNFKRLAPGKITAVTPERIFHDCTTLGGCSGGIVFDLSNGQALGLHFAGRFLESNYAVPAAIVAERLATIQRSGPVSAAIVSEDKPPALQQLQASPSTQTNNVNVQTQTFSFNVPIEVTVTVGQPVIAGATAAAQNIQATQPANVESEDEYYTEGVAEDYDDRTGYNPAFLGNEFMVPLPEIADPAKAADVLRYDRNGEQDHVLRYEHFSVVMSKKRRLCYFSAVNINGAKSRKATRVGWRTDPRIAKDAQILKECYGNPPKFSRGHMTRREDPVWGSETAALRGNADSMCVTNTIPQMQSFNAPVWLGLEDYALDHAREDGMKITVFTGPVFRKNDPVIYGIKIPVISWKIIVFINDETGKLSATAYKMSQKDHLPEEEFVFGEYEAAQTSIANIEKLTGLSFGDLSAHDPLNEQNELQAFALEHVKQIRF
ncbi:DNA/RNA non-specific endonuclease [Chitinophaga pinensis]|uniref:DNA/RNA non-specific endonuclease n=1 Tax=Chitinophaga pinensis (strain ATCC 43595 / DSM 2588 / LMG 13176 / NBRC 15968 / NCIMB 11800 / UQM 2034) TaxID=485918 RepID=A0A979G4B0_CHIPD|nr:DNA/RNA non-specific endonuclease [Chitinophaga pinensis]ACU60717.1 DNA/RNA non-specific endonuclease [Chitinophaga pinensis DSM 2588]